MDTLNGKKEKSCVGTNMYLNAISDGHIQYLTAKANAMQFKDAQKKQDAEIIRKKIQTEKLAEMSKEQKGGIYSNQLEGLFNHNVNRIHFTFKIIRKSLLAIKESFSEAMKDGKIDENEANQITIKSLMVVSKVMVANVYIRRITQINTFIQKMSKKIKQLAEIHTKNEPIVAKFKAQAAKMVSIAFKIKGTVKVKAELAKQKKTIDGQITELLGLVKSEDEGDDESEEKPCDKKLVEVVTSKVTEYFGKNKQLRKVLFSKKPNAQAMIVDDIKHRVQSNERLH